MIILFRLGDYVCWNFEVGYVIGMIVVIYIVDFDYKGYCYCVLFDDLQYEIKSDWIEYIVVYCGCVFECIVGKDDV